MKKSIKQNKVLGFLLALVVAVAMWLYVITVVSPESEAEFRNIPVVLQGEAALGSKDRSGGLMLMMDEVPSVDLVLTGNRSDLNKLNASNITVTADLSKIYEEGTHMVRIDVSYPGDIPNGAINVKHKEPGSIAVPVEKKTVDKPVPVVISDGGTNVQEGFIIQSLTMDYDQIFITGPTSVTNKITQARIDVNYDGRSETFREDYFITLCDADGQPVDSKWIEVDRGSVLLTAEIHQVKELPLTVTVENGGGATGETSEVTILPETVHVHGTKEDLKDLDAINLGTIKLGDYAQDAEIPYELIQVMPENVEVMGDTQTANVSVKFKNLHTVDLVVRAFETVNVPDGMRATILARELKVRMRGPKGVVEKIQPKNVKIVLDLSQPDLKQGNNNVVAKIQIHSMDAGDSGALGTYTVPVTLTKIR